MRAESRAAFSVDALGHRGSGQLGNGFRVLPGLFQSATPSPYPGIPTGAPPARKSAARRYCANWPKSDLPRASSACARSSHIASKLILRARMPRGPIDQT